MSVEHKAGSQEALCAGLRPWDFGVIFFLFFFLFYLPLIAFAAANGSSWHLNLQCHWCSQHLGLSSLL